jgi:hypothetical protein
MMTTTHPPQQRVGSSRGKCLVAACESRKGSLVAAAEVGATSIAAAAEHGAARRLDIGVTGERSAKRGEDLGVRDGDVCRTVVGVVVGSDIHTRLER